MGSSIEYTINDSVFFKALPFIKTDNKILYMAMLFSYFLGLRATQVVSLSWNDVNIEKRRVIYTDKKYGKVVKEIPENVMEELISFKREKEHEETDPIFLSSNNIRMSVRMITKKLRDILEKHTLDHFNISDLYKLHKRILSEDIKLLSYIPIHPVGSKHKNNYLFYNSEREIYKIR